jgi:hypothetical protein
MFARIARIVVVGLALTVLGVNGVAAATTITASTHVAHTAGDDHHCC